MNIQGLFPLGLTYLISLMSKGLPRVFSNTTIQKPFQRNRNARRHSQSERPGLSPFGWLRASWIGRRCNKLHSTVCIVLLSEFVSRNAWLQHYQQRQRVAERMEPVQTDICTLLFIKTIHRDYKEPYLILCNNLYWKRTQKRTYIPMYY